MVNDVIYGLDHPGYCSTKLGNIFINQEANCTYEKIDLGYEINKNSNKEFQINLADLQLLISPDLKQICETSEIELLTPNHPHNQCPYNYDNVWIAMIAGIEGVAVAGITAVATILVIGEIMYKVCSNIHHHENIMYNHFPL